MTGRTKSGKIISDNYIHNNNFLCFLTPVQYKRGQSRDPVDWTVTLVLNPTTRHALTQCVSSSLPSDQCLSPTFQPCRLDFQYQNVSEVSCHPFFFPTACLRHFFMCSVCFRLSFCSFKLFCFFFPFYDVLLLYSYPHPLHTHL